jgi:hypothetical protein
LGSALVAIRSHLTFNIDIILQKEQPHRRFYATAPLPADFPQQKYDARAKVLLTALQYLSFTYNFLTRGIGQAPRDDMSVSRKETLPAYTPEGFQILARGKKSGTMPLFLPLVNDPAQENVLRESAIRQLTDGFPQNAKPSGRLKVRHRRDAGQEASRRVSKNCG